MDRSQFRWTWLTVAGFALALGNPTLLSGQDQPADPGAVMPLSEGTPVELATTYVIRSEILDQERRFNVFLPPGYAASGDRFPLLLLLDGGVEEDFLHIAGIAALGAEWRGIRKFVLIGIEGIDRYHDLIPESEIEEERERWPTSGGAAKFRKFLAQELMPHIEANFRLTDETVLIGESAAALFVTETFLVQPELFQAYVAISPSLWWNRQVLARSAGERLKAPFPSDRRLFLTIANEGGEMREGVDRLAAALESHAPKDLDWVFEPMESETHATIFHPAALCAVRWIFATE